MDNVNLHPHQLRELLERHDIEILDMRGQAGYVAGRTQAAKPASDGNVGRLLQDTNPGQTILIYCYHGNSSLELANFFAGLGFREVFNLNRGWQAWETCLQAS
jgi:thiosulfate sulfurtransferase